MVATSDNTKSIKGTVVGLPKLNEAVQRRRGKGKKDYSEPIEEFAARKSRKKQEGLLEGGELGRLRNERRAAETLKTASKDEMGEVAVSKGKMREKKGSRKGEDKGGIERKKRGK